MKSSLLAQADAFHIPLADNSVHCVITSPPYWGLRKYAGDQGQEPLGLEPTPERHIERTVEWAREVWRVLRPDGVFWLNYGDVFATGSSSDRKEGAEGRREKQAVDGKRRPLPDGMAAGNLMLMPYRIALALQSDGWIVRQDLVWSKPNPMPESVNGWRWQREREVLDEQRRSAEHPMPGKMPQRAHAGKAFAVPEYDYGPDYELRRGSWRHTRAHEYVFMLVKGMQYWSDQEAVREANTQGTLDRIASSPVQPIGDGHKVKMVRGDNSPYAYDRPSGRNPRSVLHIPTAPYRGAHYATFPPALIAPLILATCPRWCCLMCGQGWAPVVEPAERIQAHWDNTVQSKINSDDARGKHGATSVIETGSYQTYRKLGYRPTCSHSHIQAEAVPGIVFDPFVGSGTTVATARELLRVGIGIDISRPYLVEQALIRAKLGMPNNVLDDLPLFRK